tara:strand:+ start:116555 stop:117118 length:564 start_codon:yes stop_codon:yes gene_type:complete
MTQLTAELVHDLIVEPIPTLDICARHEINLTQLRELVESDEFAAIVSELNTIDRLRTPIFRRRAINTLEAIMLQQPSGPAHAESIRKAAAHYLRITAPAESLPQEHAPEPDPDKDPDQSPQPNHPSSPAPTDLTQDQATPHPTPASSTPHEYQQSPPPATDTKANALRHSAGQPTAHHPPPTPRRSA